MTRIKFCGLTRMDDIEAVNELKPEYIGFVFAEKSRRYISPGKAAELKKELCPGIKAVGVFVNEKPENVAALLKNGIIDMAQLHGNEDDGYIRDLRLLTGGFMEKYLIQAFRIDSAGDIVRAQNSPADHILLDSGDGGTGTAFDWSLIREARRPYFLAGGLGADNISAAVESLGPYAVDVSSKIETDGVKDREKMKLFADIVRRYQN